MIRPTVRSLVVGVVVAAVSVGALSACGSDGGSGNAAADNAVKSATEQSDATINGSSSLDIAASAIVKVLASKFSGYEIDGDTVVLNVKDGATLSGSECTIVTSATSGSNPEATFVINDHGKKTTC